MTVTFGKWDKHEYGTFINTCRAFSSKALSVKSRERTTAAASVTSPRESQAIPLKEGKNPRKILFYNLTLTTIGGKWVTLEISDLIKNKNTAVP